MLFSEPQVKIWLCTQPVDMRKSYDGLSALVRNRLGEDPLSGQLFVFINKRKTHMKVLYFEPTGYCVWCKRLEQGQFNFHPSSQEKYSLNWTQLHIPAHPERRFWPNLNTHSGVS